MKAAMELIGTRKEASIAAGRSHDQLEKIADGRSTAAFETLARIADAAGVDLNWLATGEGEMRRWSDTVLGTRPVGYADVAGLSAPKARTASFGNMSTQPRLHRELVQVPVYDARASAGPGAFVDQDLVVGHFSLDSAWMREVAGANAERLVMTQAVGNSMEPTIFSGDRLLVETGDDTRFHGAIYVVVYGGDIMVKRYFRGSSGSFTLHSDNRAAGDIVVGADDQVECRLVGRVRLILRVP